MPFLIAVMGSTASGKTDFAEALAEQLGARLVNADNFCCYRYLDIGTAKPEHRERYELLDILDPNEPFGVGAWVKRAAGVILGEPPPETGWRQREERSEKRANTYPPQSAAGNGPGSSLDDARASEGEPLGRGKPAQDKALPNSPQPNPAIRNVAPIPPRVEAAQEKARNASVASIPPRVEAARAKAPEHIVLVGGSGLNTRALFDGYEGMSGPPPEGLREALNARELPDLVAELEARDPDAASKVDLQNPVRVRRALERLDSAPAEPGPDLSGFKKIKFGLDVPVDWVNDRIERRVDLMLEQGWLDEVDQIRQMGFQFDDPGLKAHGYRNLWEVLEGRKTLDQARLEIITMVKQYAKRQRTWMRTERNLCKISAEDGRRAVSDALLLLLGE